MFVAFGTAATAMVYLGAGYPYGPIFLTVALGCFSAIVAGHRRAAWAARRHALGRARAGGALAVPLAAAVGGRARPPGGRRWSSPPGSSRSWRCPSWSGYAASSGPATARERRQAAKRRADEERLRIARELHDVLAHSISVINVQAGVGLALLDSDPEQARTALTTIKAASKEALGEVRQVLDTLRAPGDAPRAPAPGLDRLPELVEQAAGAGLTVDVEGGGAAALPPGADLAAFRIVQEALTNVVRHSGSRHARVRVDHAARRADGCVSTTTGRRPARTRAAAATGWPECGSGPRPWVARSRRARVTTEASGCWPYCR